MELIPNKKTILSSTCQNDLNAIISYRGSKITIPLTSGVSVGDIKLKLVTSVNEKDDTIQMNVNDLNLLYKGKILTDDTIDLYELCTISSEKSEQSSKKLKDVKLMATGVSKTEVQKTNSEMAQVLKNASRIRDDLTNSGKREIVRRRQLGRAIMSHVAAKQARNVHDSKTSHCKFHCIETLPMLPEQNKAKGILTTLANDPGILRCMAKHGWSVGCLAELYPEGKVGESEVCVMGLNQNRGHKILLRIRTDDLRGFRKMLSIRKVLFHELAHNVHDEHDDNFFRLMRQVERECNDLDWTQSNGRTTGGRRNTISYDNEGEYDFDMDQAFVGGSGKLGGTQDGKGLTISELAARAAARRMTEEEREIQMYCGCKNNNKIKAKGSVSQSSTTLEDLKMNDDVKKDED